jgi:hypothetical protein
MDDPDPGDPYFSTESLSPFHHDTFIHWKTRNKIVIKTFPLCDISAIVEGFYFKYCLFVFPLSPGQIFNGFLEETNKGLTWY